ncbi:MAG: six-hairpin glycosidase [Prevotella sp.]|nr:six-hairpin glycosidase [Prevotella sp.]
MADEQLVEGLIKYNRDVVHYSGSTIARPERHDGGLKPVVGVHTIQTMRGAKPWTYNHQPMMAYWNGKFYMHYLTDPRHEHEAPGKTMLQTSTDGYRWSTPVELFPEYDVPEGWTKEGRDFPPAHHLKAVMHQRVGWYVYKGESSKLKVGSERLLAVGNYGICLTIKDDPNDGNGIGRVVREIKKDGTFGPIYFVYYNHGFSEKNTDFPYYKKSKDKGFVAAVDAMLADPMQRMQWVEEADRNDPLIPLNKPYKAFSGYTLPDGRKVALWKHAVTSLSADGGHTWRQVDINGKLGCDRAPGFVNSNAKIWGQRLTDGTYATVYNPSEYRWPLAISLSKDGLEYTTLSLIHGEVTPLRHGGQYKSYGPQYVRGIQEGNGIPKDSDLWVTYSNNKEDMWVSRIPVPVRLNATTHAKPFGNLTRGQSPCEGRLTEGQSPCEVSDLTDWNLYMPQLCPVTLKDGWLSLYDSDPYDYAKVERVIPNTKELEVEFDLKTAQNTHGELDIEFMDDGGNVCSRIVVDSTGVIRVKGGARYATLLKHYEAGTTYHIKAVLSTSLHRAVYYLNGKKACERQFDTPVESISRIVFRTGMPFDKPDYNTPADQDFDMPRADESDPEVCFAIANVVSRPVDDSVTAVLDYDDYAHYADYFNTMEDENIVTTIPNAQSSEWMRENIPLFDCPQENFREMFYYRWWTLRKHIKRTPVGYGMTEFLVQRSYADRYNLIACAIGHHIMESRWLRDTTYLHQILRTWYYGNDGQPMTKMNKFSSWNPVAVLEMWKVQGDTTFMLGLKPRLEEEYARWERTNRLANGLYWQGDVQDGMEESISGGRKKQYARPTINSYMFGNAKALSFMNSLTGETAKVKTYQQKADTLRNLIETKLWNEQQQFFETHRGDSSANVREAIGYIPWYFNLPAAGSKYDVAWQQLLDEKGFSAPYGLTTAERRHPLFRSHGFGKCEWDGAVWPFATSQTLTALANHIENGNPTYTNTFFRQMELYVESQHHRGRPYIGEYLDETNGAWLMGDRERSRYYNHSTFNDLMITGICGLRPQQDGSIVVNPLVPQDKWDYFCLDGIRYRGHILTILWDKDGQRYHQGTGLTLMVDGKVVAHRKDIGLLKYE